MPTHIDDNKPFNAVLSASRRCVSVEPDHSVAWSPRFDFPRNALRFPYGFRVVSLRIPLARALVAWHARMRSLFMVDPSKLPILTRVGLALIGGAVCPRCAKVSQWGSWAWLPLACPHCGALFRPGRIEMRIRDLFRRKSPPSVPPDRPNVVD